MKIILSEVLDTSTLQEDKLNDVTEKDVENELKQMLFDVCENWILRGQEPYLEFEK